MSSQGEVKVYPKILRMSLVNHPLRQTEHSERPSKRAPMSNPLVPGCTVACRPLLLPVDMNWI